MQFFSVLIHVFSFSCFRNQHPNEDQLGFENTGTVEEKLVHCPPASLVPRIHCILAQKLVHTNPLMPKTLELNNGMLLGDDS